MKLGNMLALTVTFLWVLLLSIIICEVYNAKVASIEPSRASVGPLKRAGHCAICKSGLVCWDAVKPKFRSVEASNGWRVAYQTHEMMDWRTNETLLPSKFDAEMVALETEQRSYLRYLIMTNLAANERK